MIVATAVSVSFPEHRSLQHSKRPIPEIEHKAQATDAATRAHDHTLSPFTVTNNISQGLLLTIVGSLMPSAILLRLRDDRKPRLPEHPLKVFSLDGQDRASYEAVEENFAIITSTLARCNAVQQAFRRTRVANAG